jgi:putative tryptophan/tyrosine transport system substrate-binding protein
MSCRQLIATGGLPVSLAAKAATTIIPIVFATAYDPVYAGLVSSLNRPGANLTGTGLLVSALLAKRSPITVESAKSLARREGTLTIYVDERFQESHR